MSLKNVCVAKTQKTARRYLSDSKLSFLVSALWWVKLLSFCGCSVLMYGMFFAVTAAIPCVPSFVAYGCAALVSFAFWLFVLAPFSAGIELLLARYVSERVVSVSCFLAFFAERKRYRFAVFAAGGRALRFGLGISLVFSVLYFGKRVATALIDGGDLVRATVVLCGTVLFLFIAVWLWWLFSADAFLLDAVHSSAPSLTYRQAALLAKRGIKHYKGKVFARQLRVLGLVFLSAFALGIPLFWVIPYAKLSKHVLALECLQC